MSDDFGMSAKDLHIEPKQAALNKRAFNPDEKINPYQVLPRANLLIVRDHLQNAMRAGLNSEALRCVVAAIKEIER